MEIVHLFEKAPSIASQLLVQRQGLGLVFSLPGREPPPPGVTLISNFKPWLSEPDLPRLISTKRADGKFDQIEVTGRRCIAEFARLLYQVMPAVVRSISKDTIVQVSEPAFTDLDERKIYQGAVARALQEAGFSRVEFMREPDAVFEFFRLFRRDIKPVKDQKLNVLIVDFGGGTCNVSAVQTAAGTGAFYKRAVSIPIAAEAPQAGGLYIDRELLARALSNAGFPKVVTAGKNTSAGKAFDGWRTRHTPAAEALKIAVSMTGKHMECTVPLDEELSKVCGGQQSVVMNLDRSLLTTIVRKHWNQANGIEKKVEEVLGNLRTRAEKLLHQKDLPQDPRELVTDVIIAGGSSQLPGFHEMLEAYFLPHGPRFHSIGSDFAFAVAAGIALHRLDQARALRDLHADPSSAALPAEFLAPLTDDLEFRWRAGHENAFSRDTLYEAASTQLLGILEPKESLIAVPRSDRPFNLDPRGKRRFQFQIVKASDPHANKNSVSDRRLNVSERDDGAEASSFLYLAPEDAQREHVILHRQIVRRGDRLNILISLQRPGPLGGVIEKRRFPLDIDPKRLESTAPSKITRPGSPASLQADGIDMLCLDFGTTNTALLDLRHASTITGSQFKFSAARSSLPLKLREHVPHPIPQPGAGQPPSVLTPVVTEPRRPPAAPTPADASPMSAIMLPSAEVEKRTPTPTPAPVLPSTEFKKRTSTPTPAPAPPSTEVENRTPTPTPPRAEAEKPTQALPPSPVLLASDDSRQRGPGASVETKTEPMLLATDDSQASVIDTTKVDVATDLPTEVSTTKAVQAHPAALPQKMLTPPGGASVDGTTPALTPSRARLGQGGPVDNRGATAVLASEGPMPPASEGPKSPKPPRVHAAGEVPAPLTFDAARALISCADERDAIFDALCRAVRSRVAFAAVFTVHGDVAFGRAALEERWLDRQALSKVSIPLDRPSAFRIAAKGRLPYTGRLGEQPAAGEPLAMLGRKPPLFGAVMPVLVRGRPVALVYLDDEGRELAPGLTDSLRPLVAEVSQAFQRLVLRNRAGGIGGSQEPERDRQVQEEMITPDTSALRPPEAREPSRPPRVVDVRDSGGTQVSGPVPSGTEERPTTKLRVDHKNRTHSESEVPTEVKAVAAKIGAKPEVKVEPKPEVKVEPKPEVKVEAKPEVKVEAKPPAKPDVKVEPKPEKQGSTVPEVPAPADVPTWAAGSSSFTVAQDELAPQKSQNSDVEDGPTDSATKCVSGPPTQTLQVRPAPPAPKPLPGESFAGDEKAFVDYFEQYCAESSFHFPRTLLESVYLAFKTRPFMVLAGPSGVGKSALSRLFAESMGCSIEACDALRVAIEAHWTDGRHLFGRLGADGSPIETDFLRLLRCAVAHPQRQYHVLLDEMNLAHVEYYFAQLLSAMEGDGVLRIPELASGPLTLPLHEGDTPVIFFTGTINVDETTQTLSDKVVDRATIIEVDAEPPPQRIWVQILPDQADQRRNHFKIEWPKWTNRGYV